MMAFAAAVLTATLGATATESPASGELDEAPPRMFWQGSSFCVLQGDDSGKVRCYDVVKRAWGKRRSPPKDVPSLPFIANSVRFSVCTKDGSRAMWTPETRR